MNPAMGFRRLLTCGLDDVHSEWTIVSLAWNPERVVVLRPQQGNCRIEALFLAKETSLLRNEPPLDRLQQPW